MDDANIQECMWFCEQLKNCIKHRGISLSPIGSYVNLHLIEPIPLLSNVRNKSSTLTQSLATNCGRKLMHVNQSNYSNESLY